MKTVSSTVEINASPERVWAILTDLPGHASWDPFITAISGSLVPGQKLNVTIHPPGTVTGRRPSNRLLHPSSRTAS